MFDRSLGRLEEAELLGAAEAELGEQPALLQSSLHHMQQCV